MSTLGERMAEAERLERQLQSDVPPVEATRPQAQVTGGRRLRDSVLEATTSPELDRVAAATLKDAVSFLIDAKLLCDRIWAFDQYRSTMLRDKGLNPAQANLLLDHQTEHLGLDLLWDVLGSAQEAISHLVGYYAEEGARDRTYFVELGEALDRLEGVHRDLGEVV